MGVQEVCNHNGSVFFEGFFLQVGLEGSRIDHCFVVECLDPHITLRSAFKSEGQDPSCKGSLRVQIRVSLFCDLDWQFWVEFEPLVLVVKQESKPSFTPPKPRIRLQTAIPLEGS